MWSLNFQTFILSTALTAPMPPGDNNFNSSCTQKIHKILFPRLVSFLHKPPKAVGHQRSKRFEFYFCLLLSETCSSWSQSYPFWSTDIPTSQSALKQSFTEKTNGQDNDDKIKKFTLGNHLVFGSILLYFHVTNNKVMAVLTILNMYQTNIHQFLTKQESEEARMKLL